MTQRTSVALDTWQLVHVRMSAQGGHHGAVGLEQCRIEVAAFGEHSVLAHGLVSGTQQEAVTFRPIRASRIDVHDVEVQRRDEVDRRHGTAQMAGMTGFDHPDDIAAGSGSMQFEFGYPIAHSCSASISTTRATLTPLRELGSKVLAR